MPGMRLLLKLASVRIGHPEAAFPSLPHNAVHQSLLPAVSAHHMVQRLSEGTMSRGFHACLTVAGAPSTTLLGAEVQGAKAPVFFVLGAPAARFGK